MEKVFEKKSFQKKLKAYSESQNIPLDEVLAIARTCLKELYTEQQPVVTALAIQGAEYILSRGYDNTIDVNPLEIKQLAKIVRNHSVAFVMTHKTYIDMFVLGVVLARHGLPIPYVFGGINMAFFGLGDIGRKAGAIFIRRSFKEDEIYKITLRHFISNLVDNKAQFMWAIEGTRSRTGKIVWPKMGILKYISEAEADSPNEVKYIPVSIVYDLIPDVADMMREGRGLDKSPESIGWFLNYIRKMGKDFGKISIRFGDPVLLSDDPNAVIPVNNPEAKESSIPKFAFELVHGINHITPVTTTSLICASLLSKFALSKRALEHVSVELMQLIESHKSDALVDRGKPIGQSVQNALIIMEKARLIQKVGDGIHSKYSIVPENYLSATYYANMAVHHLYHRAFIELAFIKVNRSKSKKRLYDFWVEIMKLRDLFKFEFFYSNKAKFSDEIEQDLDFLLPDWKEKIEDINFDLEVFLHEQSILISPVVLNTYLEAYTVVGNSLLSLDTDREYNDEQLLRTCLFLGEEMHWKGQIHRVDSVSKPFIANGIRLAQNKQLLPVTSKSKKQIIKKWVIELKEISSYIKSLQENLNTDKTNSESIVDIDRNIVPGSVTASITKDIMAGERGAHIGAFFDLDRTLISGFSAKQFAQTRIMSGKMGPKEIIAQFSGVMTYAIGNRNFAALAAVSANGVKGIKEKVFIDVGEEVYTNYLSKSIYPESRALVDAHLAMGHTVAIISAATPYQVNPVARDLGIEHIMCTRMEVEDGAFTGYIIEPACWGEGKAKAAEELVDTHNLDLTKSYFYTDSVEDMPLMEIVGHPQPVNPDSELAAIAFERDWPIYRFNDESKPGLENGLRTILAMSSLIPATLAGITSGTMNMSWRDGANSMTAILGDLGTKLAGMRLVVKNEQHLWSHRPAVFIFNHQSNADLLIMAKLLRKDAVAIAKKELKYTPLGPIFAAAGVIFIDRKDKAKAIEELKPAVVALQNGTSIGIAPEGTRSYNYKLGKFKKGAFHLAMQARVPIVPIVIMNAHDVMPRGSNLIRPTAVEVIVQAPIMTDEWSKENLDEQIAMVRQIFLDSLHQVE